MQRVDARLIIGLLLIAGGLIFLLDTLNIVPWGPLVWAAVFGLAGAGFFGVFARDRGQWWALIPAFALLGLAGDQVLDYARPDAAGDWGGALFLGSLGLGFFAVYLANQRMWWAIIPGGVVLTLAAVAGVEASAGENGPIETAGVFFVGLALTFLLVYILPTPGGPLRWALYPAAALLVAGLLFFFGFDRAIAFIFPAALIGAGVLLLLRAFGLRA